MGRTPPVSPVNLRAKGDAAATATRSPGAPETPAVAAAATGAGGNDNSATPASEKVEMSAEEVEAARIRAAVEESYRPRVSEVYGVHVPLGERAARLQCLAVLRLVAGGEDDASLGGGSGSGGELQSLCSRLGG